MIKDNFAFGELVYHFFNTWATLGHTKPFDQLSIIYYNVNEKRIYAMDAI